MVLVVKYNNFSKVKLVLKTDMMDSNDYRKLFTVNNKTEGERTVKSRGS